MSRFTYSPAMLNFIQARYKEVGVGQVAAEFNLAFGTAKTKEQIRAALKNNNFTSGRAQGELNRGVLKAFTQEQMEYLKDQYKLLDVNELTAAFNQKFGTSKETSKVRAFLKNHGIRSGRTGQFVPAQTSWNSGMVGWSAGGRSVETRFKPGRSSLNIKPVGSTRVDTDGYKMIKIAMPNKWRGAHLVEWEKHFGPIPKGMRVHFKDSDRTNCSIDNLILVTAAQSAVMNKMGLGRVDPEFKQAAIALADISMMRRQRSESGKANKEFGGSYGR